MKAPVILFVYNRPQHTRHTVEALLKNAGASETDLFIFSDGPKNENAATAVSEVREYLKTIAGFLSVTIVERPANFGLSKSIIEGVTRILAERKKAIVLEDDLETAPFFLDYMNEGLDLYADDEAVSCIHGFVYPVKQTLPETFFIRGADCWGWATWARAWDCFEPDAALLKAQLQKAHLGKLFDFGGTYGYQKMLDQQIKGQINSWAIRWYASAFLKDTYTLYPGVSLVRNCGHDGSGTHGKGGEKYDVTLASKKPLVQRQNVVDNVAARQAFADYFKSLQPSFIQKIVHRLRRLFF